MDNILLACTVGDIAWLKRCLSADPDHATSRNQEGLNSLHLAAKNGHLECLKHLLNNCSIGVDEAVPSSGQTALHFSISTKNGVRSLQCMKLLLERGADQNKQNKSGQTPLHIAAKKGHTKCLKRLLEQGADFDITDNDERTACDIATLHGHYECARLLQALHWAKRKDDALRSELQAKTARRREEREKRALHARLRKEAAKAAYSDWASKKSKPTVQPPGACKERQELRSQPRTPHACSSCLKTGTRKQSAKETDPQVTSPVTITMHQAKRNTESTGKSDKMHPYTNYPPQKQRAKTSKKPAGRSGRQSRATKSSTRSTTPANTDCRNEKSNVRDHQSPQPEEQYPVASEPIDETHTDSQSQYMGCRNSHASDCVSDRSEFGPPSELNLGFLKATTRRSEEEVHSREFEDQVRVHFLVGGMREEDWEEEEERGDEEEREEVEEEEEEDEEDIAFHDVGKANSLDALALPSLLTRDQTPAEVIQLLRCLGNTQSPRNYSRSRSYSSHFNRRPSLVNRLQRRFSLGAIPEGQMVTNYSNESVSSLGDKSIQLRYADTAWEEEEDNQMVQSGDDRGEWFICEGEEEEEEEGKGQDGRREEEEEEGGRKKDVHREEEREKEEEDEEDEAKESHPNGTAPNDHPPHNTTNSKPMLSIVNLAWDSSSNSVQTKVTKSSIVPANHPLQGRMCHSRPVSISPQSTSTPQLRPYSPSSPGAPPHPNTVTPPDTRGHNVLTRKSTPPKLKVQMNSTWGRRSPSPGPSPLSPARELSEAQEMGRINGSTSPDLKLPSLSTSTHTESKAPELVSTPVSPNAAPQNTPFPAHSLFGGMNSLASKSMISFGTPSTLLPPAPVDSTNTVSYTQPKLERRIKSAPNMLNLQPQNSESRPLKTSTFIYGGRLQ